MKTVERDKEPYEKDYQAEWRKCIGLLRECHPFIYYYAALLGDNNAIKLQEQIEDII